MIREVGMNILRSQHRLNCGRSGARSVSENRAGSQWAEETEIAYLILLRVGESLEVSSAEMK